MCLFVVCIIHRMRFASNGALDYAFRVGVGGVRGDDG